MLKQTFLEKLHYNAADFTKHDVYHMEVMEGDQASKLSTNLYRTGHMQLVDIPRRHEPGIGDIYYPFLFRHIDAIGDIVAWLGWVKEMN